MQRAGYGVTCARSALQALDRVRAQPQRFEIVVTDYNMPEMSGIALAEALALAAPGLPVVIASGYVTDELKAQAHTAGLRAAHAPGRRTCASLEQALVARCQGRC